MKTKKIQEMSDTEARLRNARNVTRRLLADAIALRDVRVDLELERLRVVELQATNQQLREALRQALLQIHAPSFDGQEIPGDLPVGEMATIGLELGVRFRPQLVGDDTHRVTENPKDQYAPTPED